MNDFTASNGVSVSRQPPVTDRGSWLMVDGHMTSPNDAQALREFFQHERDEALGRWRDPDNPRLTVYPTEGHETDEITILDEVDAETYTITRAQAERSQGGWWHDTAKAYFEAHPERKPWHAPDAGDHWALHIAHGMALSGDEHLYKYTRWGSQGRWGFVPTDGGSVLDPTDPTITAGRRIWPEDAS